MDLIIYSSMCHRGVEPPNLVSASVQSACHYGVGLSQTQKQVHFVAQCPSSLPLSMDDVWGNAWAQPEEDVAHKVPSKSRLNDVPSWSLSSAVTSKEEEADVGLPSWSTGELNWTEPTGQASLWSSTSSGGDPALGTDGWGTSSDVSPSTQFQATSDAERIGTNSLPTHVPEDNEAHSDVRQSEEGSSPTIASDSTETVTSVVNEDIDLSGGKPASPPPVFSSSFEVSGAPDTYGSFEDGDLPASASLDEGRITWTSPEATFDDENGEDAWGSAWKTPDLVKTDDEVQKDEWAIAQEQKARRDRTVPPELLTAILEQLDSLSADLWKDKEKPSFAQDLGNWRDGMANVVGLEAALARVIPETSEQPPIQFSKTQTARAMGKSVKLSKNLPIVRNSPMSHLFTAKSLAAWELAVKSRVDVPKDDIPVGWRAVPSETKEEHKSAPVERKSSGFLSFFSKRASATSSPAPPDSDTNSKRSSHSHKLSSDTASSPTASSSTATRNSTDANSLSSKMQQSPSVSSLASALAVGSPTASSSSTRAPSSPAPAPPEQVQPSHSEPTSQPAPSAVSRFFNRFSRTRSDTRSNSSSSRSSIALSTDDLEFLSDIVPSHSDDVDEDQQLQSLTALVSSPALPAKLPPPLAPPPLAPPPRPSSVNRPHGPQPHIQSQMLLPTPSLASGATSADPLKSPSATPPPDKPYPGATTSSRTSAATTPPPLPHPLSPTSIATLSKPSTPSPLSGGAARAMHSRTSTSSSIRSLTESAVKSPRVVSPHPTELLSDSSPPVYSGATSTGSVSVMTPISNSSIQSQLQTNLSPLSPTPPPPIEKSPIRDFVRPDSNLLDDSDDFSDFQSHETSSATLSQPNQPTESAAVDASSGVLRGMASTPSPSLPQEDPFGDFGNFISDPSTSSQILTLHSLPTSPASPPVGSIGVPPPLPKKQAPANITLHLRKPSAADHDATSRLLQHAAARPGRWPAPPSPIPNALPPPPSSSANSRSSTSNNSLLELDNDGMVQAPAIPVRSISLKPIAEITPSTLTPLKAVSPPPLLPPPGSGSKVTSATDAPLLDFGDLTQPVQRSVVKSQTYLSPPASSAGPTKSGLSAQDLSFFDSI